ncbi:venom protein 302-like [Clytia hemisphaerica]|uniref:IGFBP N-terminal domain-containing protein n=1 Tax=Clytia hemisphaerica TaxID=252671 RepID=A0A7M5XKP3_9CNID|eukprot:TCONS_00063899-protein
MAIMKLIILLSIVSLAYTLSCKCNKDKCKAPTDCKGETVMDQCGCCQVCGGTEGEACGGPWLLKRCVKGLMCSYKAENREVKLDEVGVCTPLPRRDRAAHRWVMKGKKFLKAVLKSKRLVKRFFFASKKRS